MAHEPAAAAPSPQDWMLQRQWRFWSHVPCVDGMDYTRSRTILNANAIGSVRQFWCHYNHIPAPSRFQTVPVDGLPKGDVEGWSLFEEGVTPDWEDPKHRHGATITFKAAFEPALVDECWRDALLALVGETLPHPELVTGLRVLDRTQTYRFEVWLTTQDGARVSELREWFGKHVFDALRSSGALMHFVTPHRHVVSNRGGAAPKGGGRKRP